MTLQIYGSDKMVTKCKLDARYLLSKTLTLFFFQIAEMNSVVCFFGTQRMKR